MVAVSAFGAFLLSLCFFAPRFWLWPVAGLPLSEMIAIQPEVHRAFHALQQLSDPWVRIDDNVNRVIEWRLLWPVVAHTLGLSKDTYFALPWLGCGAALIFTASLVWRLTKDLVPTASACVLLATSSWCFVSTGWLAYFDSWLIFGLLLASFGRSRWTLLGAALLTPWVDERFLLALPLCLAVRSLAVDPDARCDRRALLRGSLMLLAGVAPYVAIRIGAELNGVRATSGSYWTDRPLLPASFFVLVWGAWNGLRLAWLPLGAAAIAAFRRGSARAAVSVIAATLVLNLCVADDLSRSASLLAPVVVAVVLLGWRHRPAQLRRALPLLCLGQLFLPAQHVIAAPGTPERWHSVPILAADAEFARAKQPPEYASAAAYTRRSMDHLQNQNLPRALLAADYAVNFEPGNAKARANRGIILYAAGRQAEGAAELNRALEHAPELYDARMQRAAFRQQSGDLRGALEDVRHALADMPADWPRRADAQQFERALAAQAGR